MPRKIRQLKADLRKAAFVVLPRRGKGSHVIWRHVESGAEVNMAGADGDDAHPYQEREVRDAIARSRQADKEQSHVDNH